MPRQALLTAVFALAAAAGSGLAALAQSAFEPLPYLAAEGDTLRPTLPAEAPRVGRVDPSPHAVYFRGYAYLSVNSTAHGTELYRLDPATGEFELFYDFVPGPDSGSPSHFAVVGDSLYFAATDPVAGRELWVSDGTRGGTRIAADISEAAPGGLDLPEGEQEFTVVGGRLYGAYRTDSEFGRSGLFAYDPPTGTATLYPDVRLPNAVVSIGADVYVSAAFQRFYFLGDNGVASRVNASVFDKPEPINGSILDHAESYVRLIDPARGVDSVYSSGFFGNGSELFAHREGGQLYFNSQFISPGGSFPFMQLWRTDGTGAGTETLPVDGGLALREYMAYGERLVAVTNGNGNQLVVLDAEVPGFVPTAAPTSSVGRGYATFDGGIAFAQVGNSTAVYLKRGLDQPAAQLATLPAEINRVVYLVDLGDVLLVAGRVGNETRFFAYRLDCARDVASFTICAGDSVTVDGVTYTESTSQTTFVEHPVGCDEVSGLSVSVLPVEVASLMTQPFDVARGDTVTVRSAAGPLAWPDGSYAPSYTFASDTVATGPFPVTARTLGPCPDTVTVVFNVSEDPVSTHGPGRLAAKTLRIAPNPTAERFRVEDLEAGEEVSVYDATGRLVLRLRAEGPETPISLRGLSAGSYLVQVRSPQGERYGRVVKR